MVNSLGVNRLNNSQSRPPFTPKYLFNQGEQGLWLDPSDLSTLYQDSAGTTPVTAVEQPVGLMLDKSQGLVLGTEYITNAADREFTSDTGFWSKEGAATISGGVVNINNANGTAAIYKFNFPNTVGGYVEVSFDLVLSAGAVHVLYGTSFSQSFTTSGRVTVRMYRSAVGTFGIRATGGGTAIGTIDNISVRELPGNHAFQTTSASRPTLSARVNLLTKTEQFDDAAWTNASGTLNVTANATTAPDGTLTADRLVPAAATAYFAKRQIFTTSLSSYTFSVYAKEDTAGVYLELISYNSGANRGAIFNLSTGAVLSSLAGTTTNVGNIDAYGFRRYSITFTATIATAVIFDVKLTTTTTSGATMTGDGTSGIYVWGADLRVTNDGVDIPSYQRVNTSTDYDTTGFPLYLKFDGADDYMVTNTITPSTAANTGRAALVTAGWTITDGGVA